MQDVSQSTPDQGDERLLRYFATDRLLIVHQPDRLDFSSLNTALEGTDVQLESPTEVDGAQKTGESVPSYPLDDEQGELQITTLRLQQRNAPGEELSEEKVIDAVQKLYEHINNSGAESGLVSVSPNWLVAPCPPEQSGFGGPGARPVGESNPNPPYCFHFAPRQVLQPGDLEGSDKGEGMTVYVLDTAPSQDILNQVSTTNPLFNSLYPKLEVIEIPEIESELQLLTPQTSQDEYINVAGHDYEMVSHGLFAAGIIHSIAPQAEIKLIRVLNKYGVGTISTIRQGLEYVDNQMPAGVDDPQVIVNLSLTMVFPNASIDSVPSLFSGWLLELLEEEDKLLVEELEGYKTSGWPGSPPLSLPDGLLQQLRYPFELVCRSLYRKNVLLIAASGNERTSEVIPPALYPAAFHDVIGVGALEYVDESDINTVTQVDYTPYSCNVDKPPSEGFAVIGGDVEIVSGVPGMIASATRGIVGLWIGNLPGETSTPPDSIRWVRWAGTSFAAPVITGALTALRTGGGRDNPGAVTALHDSWIEQSSPTPVAEVAHVVLAWQGDC